MWLLLLWLTPLALALPLPAEEAAELPAASTAADGIGRVLYDQRQTGKYNIHVSIKDVAIIEVDQNEIADETYNEEDYYYDDSDLTIKPIKFTTAAATTATAAATTSTAASVDTTTASPTTLAAVNGIGNLIGMGIGNGSAYSANLLADIAATQAAAHQRPSKPTNLIIMDNQTPMGASSTSTMRPQPLAYAAGLRARTKADGTLETAYRNAERERVRATFSPPLEHIEYTPPQGHNSPIFKVKVQRAAAPSSTYTPAPAAAQCRAHQFRDAQGKCRGKRSGSILRKLFSMLMSLPLAGGERQVASGLAEPHPAFLSAAHLEG